MGVVWGGSCTLDGWAGCMYTFNKICPEPKAEASSFGMGDPVLSTMVVLLYITSPGLPDFITTIPFDSLHLSLPQPPQHLLYI